MTEERREWNPRHRIVLSVAGSADVVRQRIRVSTGVRQRELPADLYQQPGGFETLRPAMLFVHGDGDAEKLKGILDWGQYVSWGEAKAGLDRAVINDAIDAYAAAVGDREPRLRVVTHPAGRHAFDVIDDDATSRQIIASAIEFMSSHL